MVDDQFYDLVSIRAPTQGATRGGSWIKTATGGFNPRSYARSDRPRSRQRPLVDVSIRAPTQGATWIDGAKVVHLPFQSALLRKERRRGEGEDGLLQPFQSALLRKERPDDPLHGPPSPLFQSALLRKERLVLRGVCINFAVFQSALLRKERRWSCGARCSGGPFQSALLRKERPPASRSCAAPRCFNPRSYARSDLGAPGS